MSEHKVETVTWDDVAVVHRTARGISMENGIARSLLCNQHKDSKYGDTFGENTLTYFVGPQRRNDVAALQRAVEKRRTVRVFEKLGVNQWIDHGNWVASKAIKPDADGFHAFIFERRSP